MSSSYIVLTIILIFVGVTCIIVDKKDKNEKQVEKQALNDRLESIENRIKTLEVYNDVIEVDDDEE